MDKKYHSLGLMSGTSLDGIDASIIESDGDSIITVSYTHLTLPTNREV